MNTNMFRIGSKPVLLATMVVISIGCSNFSETVRDRSAGMNGSFEVTKSGLPVNWIVYTPATIPIGSYDLIIDTIQYKAGKQSLKFLVYDCSPNGGWHSPGITNEYSANPGDTYRVSFWVKNEGSRFRVQVGGVGHGEGQYDTIVDTEGSIPDWRMIEYDYTMPTEFKTIRFELNVLKAGSFWVDDIKIERLDEVVG